MEKRYVVTMDLYVFADNDADAIAKSYKLADKIGEIESNGCAVVDICEQPFGVIGNRKVVLTPYTTENER